MKNKYWLVGGLITAMLVIAGAGLIWFTQANKDEKVSLGAATQHVDAAQSQDTNYSGSGPTLGVAANTGGQNLGQINPSTSQKSTGQQGSVSGSSGGSSGTQAINPATFAEYEKYKTATQALFGDVNVGNGATLGNGQTATVVYKGWLTNGQMFDESKTNSEGKLVPFQFKVGSGQVIVGWDQGLNGMKVGGVRLIIVPPSVGYGAAGQGSIPPNSVLVFQVQLVDVK
ncbi:MAG: FKBP-type peptidyl-prolyl cis-trans isomerase [Patescibacteria group bacterium]